MVLSFSKINKVNIHHEGTKKNQEKILKYFDLLLLFVPCGKSFYFLTYLKLSATRKFKLDHKALDALFQALNIKVYK